MENMTSGLEGDLDQMMAALEEAVANNQVLRMIVMVTKQIPTCHCSGNLSIGEGEVSKKLLTFKSDDLKSIREGKVWEDIHRKV